VRASTLFKKGGVANCGNYRPISLLCTIKKLFGYVSLHRLLDAGMDDRLTDTQFGFRRNRGTLEAMLLARRAIDVATSKVNGTVHFMALDWSKAFDSVSTTGLSSAVRRAGVPEDFVSMVSALNSDRTFFVRDAGKDSHDHPQVNGICQGCPLAPFLFIVVMAVLTHDAKDLARERGVVFDSALSVNEILYADDTLLLDKRARARGPNLHGMRSFRGLRVRSDTKLEHGGVSFHWCRSRVLHRSGC